MGGFSTVTPPPSQVSATSVAQTVWSYSPRSLTDIQSLMSAIQNNDPNLLSTLSDLGFIPAPYYSGQVSLTQVASFISNLMQNYNAAGMIAGFINSNPYSLWQPNFVANLVQNPYLGFTSASQILSFALTSALASIAVSPNLSVTTILALISNAALAATAAQGLLYGLANNYYYNKWIQTVTYNTPTSVTFSTNTVISTNVFIAQNITISSGVTVTCGTTMCFFVAQVFNNQGTIVNPYGAPGGSGGIVGGGTGGVGGGGVVIIASTAAIGSIGVNGGIGGTPYASTTSYYTAGSPGVGGVFAVINGITVPSGGGGGGAGPGEPNGGGGGAGYLGAGAAGGAATVYSFANGNALITYMALGISDWWLNNVVGKAPPAVTPLIFVYGSGGGGGGGAGNSGYYGGAGGGGGGGEVMVFGNEVTAGTISAVGGTGGYNPSNYGAGGGGGGGIVLVFYGPGGLNGTMSLSLAGGGTGVSGLSGNDGRSGAPGTAYIAAVTVNG